jgi:hypothetical protein
MPCWMVFEPVMYPNQYRVFALSVAQPLPDREMLFHPATGVSVVVPVWHSRLPGDPELSAYIPKSNDVEVGLPTQY